MPIKINGYALPVKDIVTIGLAIFWMASLSFQVKANGDEIQKQSETKERIVRLEEQGKTVARDIAAIKKDGKETKDAVIANKITLAEILVAVKKDD